MVALWSVPLCAHVASGRISTVKQLPNLCWFARCVDSCSREQLKITNSQQYFPKIVQFGCTYFKKNVYNRANSKKLKQDILENVFS